MAFKPNYNQARNERARAKEQKRLEKQQRREEAAALRKAQDEGSQNPADEPDDARA